MTDSTTVRLGPGRWYATEPPPRWAVSLAAALCAADDVPPCPGCSSPLCPDHHERTPRT